MFLSCIDAQKNLVFVFRTLDRRFDLYLPDQNTIYHGSIFDMEDSPDIESHLKPRDLYRALKPITINPRHTEIERTNAVITSLDVYGKNQNKEYLARRLYLTPEGDIKGELFFNTAGNPVTEIQRFDFQEIPAMVSSFHSIIFPKKITILSPETKKGSAIFFARVRAMDSVDPLEFLLRVPEGTREVFLDEKDPKIALRQFLLDKKSGNASAVGPIEKVKKENKTTTRPGELAPATTVDVNPDADFVADSSSSSDKEPSTPLSETVSPKTR